MSTNLNQRIAWITGGGTGIGRALAIQMAQDGYHVVISGRRQTPLDDVVSYIQSMDLSASAIVCDVTHHDQTQDVANQIVSQFGKLDTCIANAGFSVYQYFEKITESQWRHQVDVNLLGTIWTIQAALPHLKKSHGRLVVISSVAGKISSFKSSAYSATKFALTAICDSLYQELYKSHVSVTNILPGFIESDIIHVDNNGNRVQGQEDRPKYLIWPADKAAKVIARAIEKRKREAVITGHGKIGAFLGQYLPGLTYWIAARWGG